ncbi:YbaK/EbsC family protein [Frisingicoccus sp.]|uniref:YbaK/EbsC family protein n=1 Tax=Frisingicoccus sp. TaxID=1918627 RepID=UPI00260846DB|nr:YbaK/EbsC family protein [Frisingicoccus sp.]MDD6232787.1 YbaK/EbsC family protein [Frisingicoccus sp.]MDY4922072.1 YbaK/EbsC family protein [Frisingicoccus sp.]
MSIDKVREYFRTFGIDDQILEFDVSSATVELAAQAVGCEPALICKSLSFKIDERTILILAAGDAKVDNKKYKTCFGSKAKMLSPDEVIERIGHAVGGVCPFAVNEGVEIYLDVSIKRFEYVYPAAGSSNSAIKLSLSELEKYSNYSKWVDVCKIPV